MVLFSRTSQLNPKSTPTWKRYGGYGRLTIEQNITPGQASSAHFSRDELCWQTGPSPTCQVGACSEEVSIAWTNLSVPFILVGVRKRSPPRCYNVALFQARVFISRTHSVVCSSWCLSCEHTYGLLGWEDCTKNRKIRQEIKHIFRNEECWGSGKGWLPCSVCYFWVMLLQLYIYTHTHTRWEGGGLFTVIHMENHMIINK